MVLLAAIMLMCIQNMNAQNNTEYSLEGINKALSKLHFTSSGVCLGNFHEGLAWVCVSTGEKNRFGQDDWYGYIDAKGNIVTSFVYSKANNFSDGVACVGDKDWNFGFIDKQGNSVIPFNFGEDTGSFSEGLARVSQKGHVGYIDKKGKLVIPYIEKESEGGSFRGGIAPIQIGKYETYFIDINGKMVIPSKQFRCEGYKDGFFAVKYKGGRFGLMDTKGNVVVPANYSDMSPLSEGLCGVEVRKENRTSGYSVSFLWGFYDINKKCESIEPKYDAVRPFSEGFAAVKMGDKWGYINKQGEMVIACSFKQAYDFHEGLAFVNTDESYSIIDKQGNFVTRLPKYEYFRGDFSEGLAVIKQNGKWGYVDIYGRSTLNPKANTINLSKTSSQNGEIRSNTSITNNSSYVGGEAAMRRFIASTMRYPVKAVENGIQGTVTVVFTVEEDGSLTNIRLKRPVARYLNEEALRIVSKMPKWQPAQKGGVNVRSEQTVNIYFRLR